MDELVQQSGRATVPTELQMVKVNIGDTLQMKDFSAEPQKFFVKLIGYLNKRSVLVSHPARDGKLVFVKAGQSFLLRGFSGTKTYEFNAGVLEVCLTPFPYLHLSFPEQVKTFGMRSELRIRLKLVCSVESRGFSAKGQKQPSVIEDISTSGIKVRASRELGKPGEEVTVSFRLPIDGDESLFIMPALIRNVSIEPSGDSGDGMVIRHGMEFQQPEGQYRMALQNYIYKMTLEG